MWSKLKKAIGKLKRKKRVKKIMNDCGNVCYCSCGEPLNDDSDCVSVGDAIYNYTCAKCKANNVFHFGIAPVPIKLDDFFDTGNVIDKCTSTFGPDGRWV